MTEGEVDDSRYTQAIRNLREELAHPLLSFGIGAEKASQR
jgi:hypothetical protein